MEKYEKGLFIAIIAAIVGLSSVFLSLIIPELFGWYRIETTVSAVDINFYLTGFGTIDSNIGGTTTEIAILVSLGGILVIAGAIGCVSGANKQIKKSTFIGGVLMLVGPLLLLLDLLAEMSDYAIVVGNLVEASNGNIFWDSWTDPIGDSATWSVWIGFFMALGGGVLGLITGAVVEE